MKIKIIAFVVTLIHIVCCHSISTSAIPSKKTTTETNELRINESFFQQENTTEEIITEETNASITNKLTTIITKDFFDADEIISISFDSTNVVEYYYITEDISVSNENTESM